MSRIKNSKKKMAGILNAIRERKEVYAIACLRSYHAYHSRINYDLNLESAEFLELGLCDFGETLFSARH